MDILQPLPIDKWNELKDISKRDWPAYAYYYNYVENSIKWKTKDPSMKIEFYCPNGRTDAGVFIGKSDHGRKEVLLFSFDESNKCQLEALQKTHRIDWSDSFNCFCVHENFRDVLRQFLDNHAKSKGLQYYKYFNSYFYFKSKEDCLNIKLQYNRFGHIKTSNILKKTLEFLTTVRKINGSYGLFLKKDNTLVSWILQSHLGALGILQTLDEFKGKGYGKAVTRAQMKYLAEKENSDVTAFVFETNKGSQRLLESLGLVRVTTLGWFDINQ